MNELAGKPLRYKIGTDNPGPGRIGEIIEVSYDVETPSPVGLAIAYGNLLDERNEGRFPPYREQTGTAKQYDEGVPDANGPGFEANLVEQFQRRKLQGFRYIELDNPDAYDVADVIRATDLARVYGLGVIAKNPLAMDEDATRWLAHPNVYGVIVERDAGTPDQMQVLRIAAGKPDLPVWFVFFGSGLAYARSAAIRAGKFSNMGVTFDHAADEYGGDIEDLQLPIASPTQGQAMAWRVAKSLATLRDQVNAKWPNRDKSSDGTIGDASHQATNSDHNPNAADVVTAMDITNDPAHGLSARALAEALVASRDPRIKYIISNAQIVGSDAYERGRTTKPQPWVWRPYSGSNAHREHVHISVMGDPALYDDPRSWDITAGAPAATSNLPSGKGSWYSQFEGKYSWVDKGDEPGSAALGVPDDAQGISFYDRATLGKWFEVHYPNGFVSIEQQTDIGPNPRTGRLIDISAAAAERAGYSPRNFPTDSIFSWRQVSAPAVVAGLTPQQQATTYRDRRSETPMAEPEIITRKEGQQQDINALLNVILKNSLDQLRPYIEPILKQAAERIVEELVARILADRQILLPASTTASNQQKTEPVTVDPPKEAPAPATPAIQRPSMQIGGLASVATIFAQVLGALPPSVGSNATTAGILTTLAPIAVTALAPTGVWGTLLKGAVGFFSAMRNASK